MAAQTVDEILNALNDYSDYEELASVPRARSFITAAKRFLQIPASQSDKGSSLGYDQASVREMLRHARAFVESRANNGAGVRYIGVGRDFRR